MQNPLVSIIIPTYNRAHLIGETLDSVIAQTYTNWECIVVDDGSTDNTNEVLKRYCEKDSRIQYYYRPADRLPGGNAARNYGFELSKGELINWFDSDDLMLPEKILIQVNELHNSRYDYSICQTMMFDVKTNKEIGLRAPKLRSENTFEDYILFNIFWLTGAPLWKKVFLENHNFLFDEELQQAQDYDFHMRILSVSQNYWTNTNHMVIFKYHKDNMSLSKTDTKEKIFSNAKVNRNILFNYRDKLSSKILQIRYKELHTLYKNSLRKKQFSNACYILKSLLLNINILKSSFFEKLILFGKLNLGFISFFIFSKGEKFMSFNINDLNE